MWGRPWTSPQLITGPNTNTTTFTLVFLPNPPILQMHVFGLREEAVIPGGNPHGYGDNMQTLRCRDANNICWKVTVVVPLVAEALATPLYFHHNAALSTEFSCPDGLQHPKETEDPGFKSKCKEATPTMEFTPCFRSSLGLPRLHGENENKGCFERKQPPPCSTSQAPRLF